MKSEKGFISFFGVIFLILFGFLLFLTIKIAPMYFENYQLKRTFKAIIQEQAQEYTLGDEQQVIVSLAKMFQVNRITTLKVSDVHIGSNEGKLTLSANYDASEVIIGNLSAVAHFDTEVE